MSNEDNLIIFVSVIVVCMVFTCIAAAVYYFYRKKHPNDTRGHIKNFTFKERVSRGRIEYGRILRRAFPRVKVREEDIPDEEIVSDEELQGEVGDEEDRTSTPQSATTPQASFLESGSTPQGPAHHRRNVPFLWQPGPAPEIPAANAEEQPMSPRAMPFGAVNETEDDVSAKVMAPQRPRKTESPRQALWNSGSVKSGSVADTADTVTTERLGTISKSRDLNANRLEAMETYVKVTPKEFGAKWMDPNVAAPASPNFNVGTISRPLSASLTVEYPQRSRNDSVFEAPLGTPNEPEVDWSELDSTAFPEPQSDSVCYATTGVHPMLEAFPEHSDKFDNVDAFEWSGKSDNLASEARHSGPEEKEVPERRASVAKLSPKRQSPSPISLKSPRSRASNFVAQHTKPDLL